MNTLTLFQPWKVTTSNESNCQSEPQPNLWSYFPSLGFISGFLPLSEPPQRLAHNPKANTKASPSGYTDSKPALILPYETRWEVACKRGVGRGKHFNPETQIRGRSCTEGPQSLLTLSWLLCVMRTWAHKGKSVLTYYPLLCWQWRHTDPFEQDDTNLSQSPAWRSPLFWGLGRIKGGCWWPRGLSSLTLSLIIMRQIQSTQTLRSHWIINYSWLTGAVWVWDGGREYGNVGEIGKGPRAKCNECPEIKCMNDSQKGLLVCSY